MGAFPAFVLFSLYPVSDSRGKPLQNQCCFLMGDRVLRPEGPVAIPLQDALRSHARNDVMRPMAARHIGKRRRSVRRGILRKRRCDHAELRAGDMRIRMVTAVRISVQQAAVVQLGERIRVRTARRLRGSPM